MLALALDEIHLWRLDCDGALAPADAHLLDASELERAARFAQLAWQRRFLAQRAWLRRVLAFYLDLPATRLRFQQGPRGKPTLSGPTSLEFNLSHAGDLALLGIARTPLGVDVETAHRVAAPLALAERRFAPGELAWLEASPVTELLPRFLRCWTRKEAFIKATGEGLARRLASFDVQPAQPGPVRVAEEARDGSPWYVLDLRLGPGITAALCSPLAAPRVSWPTAPVAREDAPRTPTVEG